MDKNPDHKTNESEFEMVKQSIQRIPRWSYLLAILLIGILFSILSENVTIGPSWMVPLIAFILLIPLGLAVIRRHHKWTRIIAFSITGLVTLGLVSSVIFLVLNLFSHMVSASILFRNAFILWAANVLVFSMWYWEIDQGGPAARHVNKLEPVDFLFPQLISDAKLWGDWKPGYLDYLFLAYNTSTAFSPTDTMVMSRRAKLLMMTQGSISLVIVAVLAARAINIA
ncbi:hypothetical protein [Paenibacillus sp. GP183]|uniref:hypothetical protein n=1 Tax=Paenibacillus sp. GP183 TaxID=1882751 RepID=UPI0008944E66|nr:hypothetical protein [Paenibacillus sp. GP183]SEC44539.1 hypothetical protein SAMN05443246_4133 [Paenibacillus sp. GP183]